MFTLDWAARRDLLHLFLFLVRADIAQANSNTALRIVILAGKAILFRFAVRIAGEGGKIN
jgi:hypothetical protein